MSAASPDPSTDQHGLSRIQDIYQSHWKGLCQFILSKFDPPPEAEDIAQASFLRYADAVKTKNVDNPKAFLYKTASNLVIDYHRSPKHRLASEEEATAFETTEKSDVWSPENVLMGEQEAEIVEKVLMGLSERDRAFVLMNRLENMTYTEIAQRANMSRSGVQKIITQALAKCMEAVKAATHNET